ncbi:MAG: class I SAM-dependent methyltransferase [Phycisphaerales bacterium JB039]
MIQSQDNIERRPGTPAFSMLLDWARFILGIRRGFWVGQTRYKELGAEPLEHALSRRGSGAKDYRVRFADGRRMIITATRERLYADLVGQRHLDSYRAAAGAVRPGHRIVILEAGTGYLGAWLSGVVGPSGAVVALERDAESVRYARARYRLTNVSFETGGVESLAGETAGAFNVALAIRALEAGQDPGAALRELWRVLQPGGALVVGVPAPGAEPSRLLQMEAAELEELIKRSLTDPDPARIEAASAAGVRFVTAIAPAPDQRADQ